MTSRVPALIVHGLEARPGWAPSTPFMLVGFMAPGYDVPTLAF